VVRVPLVVRREASGGIQKVFVASKVKNWRWLEGNKQKNKQTGVFEEVIDTIMLKITIFTHTQVSLKTAAQNY